MSEISGHHAVYTAPIESGLTEKIGALAPGEVLLTQRAGATLQQIGRTAIITKNPFYAIGRQNAMSGIYFGEMTLFSESGHSQTQPVAVKPLGRAWKVGDEIRRAEELNQLSVKHRPHVSDSPITYVPLGAYLDKEEGVCSLTRFERGVESFDNIFWNREIQPSPADRSFALANAAEALIFLHENGFAHGDYQVKNTAADTIGARIIDISTIRSRRRFAVTDLDPYIEDLRLYISSLREYNRPSITNSAEVNEYFLDIYRQEIDDIFPASLKTAVKFKLDALDVPELLGEN